MQRTVMTRNSHPPFPPSDKDPKWTQDCPLKSPAICLQPQDSKAPGADVHVDGTHEARRRARLPTLPFIPSAVILGYNSKRHTRLQEGDPKAEEAQAQVLHLQGFYNTLHLPGLFTHTDLRKQEQDGLPEAITMMCCDCADHRGLGERCFVGLGEVKHF